MEESKQLRSGYVSIIGRPNVGKSTLLNYYLGQKVAITSDKPQTTRWRILGVLSGGEDQIIFIDTPGLHRPEHVLGRSMLEAAESALAEADVVVMLIDAKRGLLKEDLWICEKVRNLKRPALLAINKVDAVGKLKLLPLIDECAKLKIFKDYIPISAKTGKQMDILLDVIRNELPGGPRWYEPDTVTDQTVKQMISELIREQVLESTHQEVPHAIGVLIEQYEEKENVTAIEATILVERPGQKAIVIGSGGGMLKRIGKQARGELERYLGRKVYLGLWVKVKPGWRSDPITLKELGYS